jgi:hypothetical protein
MDGKTVMRGPCNATRSTLDRCPTDAEVLADYAAWKVGQ